MAKATTRKRVAVRELRVAVGNVGFDDMVKICARSGRCRKSAAAIPPLRPRQVHHRRHRAALRLIRSATAMPIGIPACRPDAHARRGGPGSHAPETARHRPRLPGPVARLHPHAPRPLRLPRGRARHPVDRPRPRRPSALPRHRAGCRVHRRGRAHHAGDPAQHRPVDRQRPPLRARACRADGALVRPAALPVAQRSPRLPPGRGRSAGDQPQSHHAGHLRSRDPRAGDKAHPRRATADRRAVPDREQRRLFRVPGSDAASTSPAS